MCGSPLSKLVIFANKRQFSLVQDTSWKTLIDSNKTTEELLNEIKFNDK